MDKKNRRYLSVILILAVFLILAAALLGQYGWMMNRSVDSGLDILEEAAFEKKSVDPEGTDCLYLWDSRDENSRVFYDELTQIFQDMKVDYTKKDLKEESLPNLQDYEVVTLGFTNYQDNRDVILKAVEWMEEGGELFVPQVPENGSAYSWMSSRIGVMNMGTTYYKVSGIRIRDDFMITGDSKDYEIAYPFESALPVELEEDCKVHIVSADESQVPILWESQGKKGHVVAVNLGHYDKNVRGIYAMAYSLLSGYCVWPVINSCSFYLDGFPFPLPADKNGYITEVYGENVSTYDFYVREWWNDLMALSGQFDIRYTAALLENNDNDVEPPYQTKGSSNRYQYFVSTLLELGGELGLYGYNQQPLCLETSRLGGGGQEKLPDYERELQLRYWNSVRDMVDGLKEAERFQKELLEDTMMQVYVPPANILSEEGLEALKTALPSMRAVAGSYLDSGYAVGQEFKVDDTGMIMTPRITSGGVFGAQDKLRTLSELNLHYAASHAISPADVMNPDAGAQLGWPVMLENLKEYQQWLADAALGLRHQTGSETTAAVQRFYYLQHEEEDTKDGLKIRLDNFQDEAWMMVRFNDWQPDEEKIKGADLIHLTGNLYLMEAKEPDITVERKDVR